MSSTNCLTLPLKISPPTSEDSPKTKGNTRYKQLNYNSVNSPIFMHFDWSMWSNHHSSQHHHHHHHRHRHRHHHHHHPRPQWIHVHFWAFQDRLHHSYIFYRQHSVWNVFTHNPPGCSPAGEQLCKHIALVLVKLSRRIWVRALSQFEWSIPEGCG